MPSPWLTTDETIQRLRLRDKRALRKYRDQGLPCHDVGGMHLYHVDEIDEWVRSRCSDLTPGCAA